MSDHENTENVNQDEDCLDHHTEWSAGPISPPHPLLSNKDAAIREMADWFLNNFEDPVESLPWDEREYVWIWGGPYLTEEVLREHFEGIVTDELITAAVELIETENNDCSLWTPNPSRFVAETI